MFTKDIYNAILASLEANVQAIRYIDFDFGQLDETPPTVSFPCVLITFGSSDDVVSKYNGQQEGTMQMTVKIACKLHERTNSLTPQQNRDAALSHLDVFADVHLNIEGLEGNSFGKITRTGFDGSQSKPGIKIWENTYNVPFMEVASNAHKFVAWKNTTPTPTALPQLDLTQEYE
jgi:hypothetical protein